MILNKENTKSFFVKKEWESEPFYISMPEDTNTFVINEQTYPHGSTFVTDKCVVSIFGLVDEKKANKLIEKSMEKYSTNSIIF